MRNQMPCWKFVFYIQYIKYFIYTWNSPGWPNINLVMCPVTRETG